MQPSTERAILGVLEKGNGDSGSVTSPPSNVHDSLLVCGLVPPVWDARRCERAGADVANRQIALTAVRESDLCKGLETP
jgi:hypothetical protein